MVPPNTYNTLSPVPVPQAHQQQQYQKQHLQPHLSPPPAFVTAVGVAAGPHLPACTAATTAVSPSSNIDGRYYHSPALSPGDWNVASPNSNVSDQQRPQYTLPNDSNPPNASPSAFLSPNTAPADLYHRHHNSASSPSTQSTWSMTSSSSSVVSNSPTSSGMTSHNHHQQNRHQQGPGSTATPPVLPENLGQHQPQQHQQQPEQQMQHASRGRVASVDVDKIQKSFMVKTTLDEGREKIASRRALDLIDAVAGGANDGTRKKSSSSSKRISYRGSSRRYAAAAATTSGMTAVSTSAGTSTTIPIEDYLIEQKHLAVKKDIMVVEKTNSPSPLSLGKLTSLATSTWSKRKKNDEPTHRETVHDYKTSVDHERETWARNKALDMLRPDRHPFNISGAA